MRGVEPIQFLTGHERSLDQSQIDQRERQGFKGKNRTFRIFQIRRVNNSYEILNADEIRQMEPLLAPIFTRAIYFPEFDSLSNPLRVVQCLFSDFRSRGGQFQSGDVVGFDLASQPRRVRTTDGHLET